MAIEIAKSFPPKPSISSRSTVVLTDAEGFPPKGSPRERTAVVSIDTNQVVQSQTGVDIRVPVAGVLRISPREVARVHR
eukprot:135605-Pyramimonas_sp.AAC.1